MTWKFLRGGATFIPESRVSCSGTHSKGLGVPQGEIKVIIINITMSGNKLKNLPLKSKLKQFNLFKPTFSIKVHFLIWNCQACNNSYKLVTRMATNLVLEKSSSWKLNLSFHLSIVYTVVCILVRMKSSPRFWRNHP